MPRRLMLPVLSALLAVSALVATAQSGPPVLFDSPEALREELSARMAEGDFEGAMTRFAPPAYQSVGRLRALGERIAALPRFEGPAVLMQDAAPDGGRELRVWWAGDVYVYVYMVMHRRADGVHVLDFRMSGDLREAVGWW